MYEAVNGKETQTCIWGKGGLEEGKEGGRFDLL